MAGGATVRRLPSGAARESRRSTLGPVASAICCALLPLPSIAQAAAEDGDELRVDEVAPGVFAVLQPRSLRFNDGNAGFVIGEKEVLIFDSTSGAPGARQIAAAVREQTDLPVRWIVNSHWHGDHVQGNAALLEEFPGATVVGRAGVEELILTRGLEQLAEETERLEAAVVAAEKRLEQGVDREGAPLGDRRGRLEEQVAEAKDKIERDRRWLEEPKTASVEFSRVLSIDLGGRVVELFGFQGHTPVDVVGRVGGVLFTGDLLDEMPFAGHGSLEPWLEALGRLRQDDSWEIAVPGHGDPLRDRSAIDRVVRWFEAAQKEQFERPCDELEGAGPLEEHRADFVGDGDDLGNRAYGQFALDLRKKACEERAL